MSSAIRGSALIRMPDPIVLRKLVRANAAMTVIDFSFDNSWWADETLSVARMARVSDGRPFNTGD